MKTTQTKRKKSAAAWTPIRDGEKTYCSPACGAGCTWDDYVRCRKESAAAVKQMGPAWTRRIYENSGWGWELIHPDGLTLHVHGYGSSLIYQCEFNGGVFAGQTLQVFGDSRKRPGDAARSLNRKLDGLFRRVQTARLAIYRVPLSE